MTPWRITVHCSDTPDGEFAAVETIRKQHMAPPPEGRGWSDIGYHFVVEPSGHVFPGRPLEVEGAGVKDANEGNIHICLIGDKRFTKDQWEALRFTIDTLIETFKISPWEIHTHNQFPSAIAQGKTCPNLSINRLLAWYWLDNDDAIRENLLQAQGASS